jgi:hypothetical protein
LNSRNAPKKNATIMVENDRQLTPGKAIAKSA